jgi:large conductance mechanosensitive channel
MVPTTITPQQVINNKEDLEDYSEGNMIEGFKKFIARGQMIDMAVGVVMGGAVTTVVNAIVKSFINPLIAMIFGKPDLDNLLAFTVNGATVSFGAILGALLNFLIIAVAIYFCIVVPINKFRDYTKKHAAQKKDGEDDGDDDVELSAEDQTIELLTEIRDQLAKQNAAEKTAGVAEAPKTADGATDVQNSAK